MSLRLPIAQTWDGAPVGGDEAVVLTLRRRVSGLELRVDAPWHQDPLPPGPPGPTPDLWRFEVVELFLLGAEQRYLEVELGPAGHHLVLALRGVRRIEAEGLELPYRSWREAGRWGGVALIPPALWPVGMARFNAFAIHGQGGGRRYLAANPPGGERPDFHRLESFLPLPPELVPDGPRARPR